MTSVTLGLSIKTISEWHVGTGGGRYGALDSRVARDSDDLPYIPASTLKGLLRDAAEQAAVALDNGGHGGWCVFAEWLFGSQPVVEALEAGRSDFAKPIGGHVVVGAAAMKGAIRNLLAGSTPSRAALRQGLVMVKPGVKIDRQSGAAADKMLRFDEVARQELWLSADIRLELADGQAVAAIALLQAACFLLDRIGGKRRRGLGKVKLTLGVPQGPRFKSVETPAQAAVWLRRNDAPAIGAPEVSAGVTFSEQDAAPEQWTVLDVSYTLLSPVLAASSVEANIVTSAEYLPGSMLLPVVKRTLAAAGISGLDDAIFRGNLRVGPAYPGNVASIVVPACFEKYKNKKKTGDGDRDALEEKKVFSLLGLPDQKGGEQMKALGGGFAVISENGVIDAVKVSKTVSTHNSVLDDTQRPGSEIGGVYVYEALGAGQTLHGKVRMRNLSGIANIAKISKNVSVGRASGSGYGQVDLQITGAGTSDPPHEGLNAGDVIRLYFSTDAICHGTTGQPSVDAGDVLRAAGRVMDLDAGTVLDIANAKALLKPKLLQSWSVAAGLPRPSLCCISAGSVLSAPLRAPLSGASLDLLTREGIGERQAEGFGVLLVNPYFLSPDIELRLSPDKPPKQPDDPFLEVYADKADRVLAGMIERNAWRHWLLNAIEAFVAVEGNLADVFGFDKGDASKPPQPNPAQLRGLKSAIMAQPEADRLAAARNFMKDLEAKNERDSAKKKRPPAWQKKLVDVLDWQPEFLLKKIRAETGAPPARLLPGDHPIRDLRSFALSALTLAAIQMFQRHTGGKS